MDWQTGSEMHETVAKAVAKITGELRMKTSRLLVSECAMRASRLDWDA